MYFPYNTLEEYHTTLCKKRNMLCYFSLPLCYGENLEMVVIYEQLIKCRAFFFTNVHLSTKPTCYLLSNIVKKNIEP